MLKVLSHCSRVLVNRLPPPPMPALLNNRWILSVACCSTISSRNRISWSSIETSAMCVVMRSPCGSFSTSQSRLVSAIASAETSHIATLQPSATSWRASSRPMPVPPPVITAIFPAKSFMELPSLAIFRLFFSAFTSNARGSAKCSISTSPVKLVPQWRDKQRDVRDTEKRDFGLFGGLNPFAAQHTQTLQRRPDRGLLRGRSLGHRRAGKGFRQPLQQLGVARAGRQIVRNDRVPERQQFLVQLQRLDMVSGLHRVPQRHGGMRRRAQDRRNRSMRPERVGRIHQRVDRAVDQSVRRHQHEIGKQLEIAGTLLDADDEQYLVHDAGEQRRREVRPGNDIVDGWSKRVARMRAR